MVVLSFLLVAFIRPSPHAKYSREPPMELMELILITTLCISLSTLIPPCSSLQAQVHSSHDQVHGLMLSLTKPPRKLTHIEVPMVKDYSSKEYISNSQQNRPFSGGKIKETDMWEFVTMDYRHVRRRQPIHNRAVPVAP
ncbi:root meristem growth factor [Tasmannia lanceolata]|uniref:root meristem growth factor n=1 Tax=Tasmannia lanceolata TaxID=3420 RepID=UPI004063C984